MLLIAESGSTKTSWCLLKGEEKYSFACSGFNPFFTGSGQVEEELERTVLPQIASILSKAGKRLQVRRIYFYGAGCSNTSRCEIIASPLRKCFPRAETHVFHDMLAAARATCGKKEGIAVILGTGSNSCYYDGKRIVKNIRALGFILGDEGSGAHIGKIFIGRYLNNELSESLYKTLEKEFSCTADDILDAVYRRPYPNRFLASFMPFVYTHREDKEVCEILFSSFRLFFEKHICKYPQYKKMKMHCVGSVGFLFRNILLEVAGEYGVRFGNIVANPMEGLVSFHKQHHP